MCRFEGTGAGALGARERTALETKERALHEIGGQCATVERDEGALLARTLLLYLLGGHLSRGEGILRLLSKELRVAAPPQSRLASYLALVWLALRHFLGPRISFLPPPDDLATPVPTADLTSTRLSLTFSATRGLVAYATTQGLHYLLWSLTETRRTRHPGYWPLAAVWDVLLLTSARGCMTAEEARAISWARARTKLEPDVQLSATVLVSIAIVHLNTGELEEAERSVSQAEALLAGEGKAVVPISNWMRGARYSLWHPSGAVGEAHAHSMRWLLEARKNGDVFGELVVRVMGSQGFLGCDDPAAAREALSVLDSEFGRKSAHAADCWWRCDLELYCQDPAAALETCRIARKHPLHKLMQRGALQQTWAAFSEAKAALACSDRGSVGHHARLARRRARKLAGLRYPAAPAMAAQIRAALAFRRGALETARTELALSHRPRHSRGPPHQSRPRQSVHHTDRSAASAGHSAATAGHRLVMRDHDS